MVLNTEACLRLETTRCDGTEEAAMETFVEVGCLRYVRSQR